MNCSISDELPEEPVVSTTSGYLFEKRLIEQHISSVTKEGLQQQGYVVVPSERRFVLLYSFVKKNLSKKIMVIFSSCNSVEFHSELLRSLHVPCTDIHGKQQQEKRRSTFFEFCKAEKGILLCTGVADIPAVDWIVQYEPPADPKEYIQRVGSTGAKGNALLFLIPQELQFLTYLKNENVAVKEYEFDQKQLANVQTKLVEKNFHLNKSSKEAYRCFILAYNSHPMKDVFNVHRLDLQAVAASFCFSCPPKVNLNIDSKNSFNESNLYGSRDVLSK